MKKTHILSLLLFVCCTILLCCSCGNNHTISEDMIPQVSSGDCVYGVDELSHTYCITDYGILYAEECNIKYYDFETDNIYILCPDANCNHQDETCSAWYENSSAIAGLALYQNACYMFHHNYSNNTYDFIKTDLTGNNRQVITSLNIGSYSKEGAWILGGIHNVNYCGDMVWFVTNNTYVSETSASIPCSQITGIHLPTGSVVTLNELSFDYISYSLKSITSKYLVLEKQWRNLNLLSESDFSDALENGIFGDYFANSNDPYYDYYNRWYPLNSNLTTSLLLYDVQGGETTILDEFPTALDFNEEGYVSGTLPRYNFNGNYKGELLCNELDRSSKINRIFLWDVENNIQTDILSLANGAIKNYGDAYPDSVVFDESQFFYVIYDNNESMTNYRFDLDTMQSFPMMEESLPVSIQLLADTRDSFIFRKFQPVTSAVLSNDFSYHLYKITKENYYNGDLDKAVKLKL